MGHGAAVLTRDASLEAVAKGIISGLADFAIAGRMIRINTPFQAPGGSVIPVVVHPLEDGRWMVHDDGFGAFEAEMSGALRTYRSVASNVAKENGLKFDQRMVFCSDMTAEWLPNAAVAVATAVQTSLVRTAEKQAVTAFDMAKEGLFRRLNLRFGERHIARDAEFTGAAGTVWRVDALVTSPDFDRRAVLEIVTAHPNSIASSFTKLSDIGAVENPPARIVVRQKPAAFDASQIVLLSRASSAVVNIEDPVEAWAAIAA